MINGMPIAYARVGDIPDMMTELKSALSQFQGRLRSQLETKAFLPNE